MTRNNLRDQLTWLLANVVLTAPNAPNLPKARDQLTSDPTSSSHRPTSSRPETRTEQFRKPPLYPILPDTSLHSEPTNGPAESAKSVRAPGGDTIGGRMGRPTSKSASKRPTLLLRQEQLLTPTSTSGGAGSLAREYTALLKNSGTAGSAKKRTSPQHQFLTPGPTFGSDHTFDAVDLTKDDELTSTNSVVFGDNVGLWNEEFAARPGPVSTTTENSMAFGDDTMVWEEEHALRTEPIAEAENSVGFGSDEMIWEEEHATRPAPLTPKRGKKRKSDQISQPPKTTTANADTDHFPDIYELLSEEEILQSNLKRSPTKSPAKTKLKTTASETPSRAPVSSKKEADYRTRGEAEVFGDSPFASERIVKQSPLKTTQKDGGLHGTSLAKGESTVFSDDDLSFEIAPETPKTQKAQQSQDPKRNDRIIEDSDDEFITPPNHAPASTAHSGGRRRTPARGLQDADFVVAFDTPSKSRPAAQNERHTPFRSARKLEHEPLPEAEQTREDGQDDSIDSGLSQVSQLMNDTKIEIDEEEKGAILDLFLAQPSVIETTRRLLEEQLQENKNAYMQSLKVGDLKPRSRLKQEKEQLVQQQTALDDLSNEYRSYEEMQLKKEALISRISDAYDQDLDTQDDEARLEDLENLLKGRRSILKDSLLKAGIDNRDLFENNGVPRAVPDPINPIVRATQPAKTAPTVSFSRETTLIPRGGTQVILQTQLPQRPDSGQSTGAREYDEASLPLQSSVGRSRRRVASPPPDLDEMIDQQPPFTIASSSRLARTPARQKSTVSVEPDPYTFDDGDDLFENPLPPPSRRALKGTTTNPQPTRSRTRNSPAKAKASHQTYQSDYSDDVDMVQVAEEFDLQQSSSERRQLKPNRPILSETSGNVGVRPQKKATTKIVDPLMSTQIPRELKNRPWFKDVRRALKDRFRMTGFRHNQLEAIDATLAGKDAFILMPTGGGKSLCYQLPAVVTSGKTRGVTVVVSPLISLMHDQVEHLTALNIKAASYSGDKSQGERFEIQEQLKERHPELHIQLLYVTPEMINKSQAFLDCLDALYRNKRLARLVIDEAHCVSQWGHDFRPDYKQLGTFRDSYPGVPIMALTATATQNVILDVKHNLGIEECEEFTQSFNRPNLYYEVLRKEKDNIESIADLINSKYSEQTGIVYTLSRKSAEKIAEKLRDHGIAARHYHASVPAAEKPVIQQEWQAGLVKVVVATIAFGMGIDKPDVRFVIHQSIPKSLEGYYQETGRAGRDGLPSECYLYFSYGDVSSLRRLITDGDGSEEQKERQRNMLNTVAAFCDNQSDCRRVEILRYFGEAFDKAQCGKTCDNCLNNEVFEQKDYSQYAVAILAILRAQGRLTLNQCTEYVIGKKKLSEYKEEVQQYRGIGKQLPKHEIHRIIDRLLAEGAVREENVFNKIAKIAIQYFRITPGARPFFNNQRRLFLTTRVKGKDSQAGPSKKQTRISQPATAATKRLASGNIPSTNVSSPVLGKDRKRKGKAVAMMDDEEDSDEGYSRFSSGYAKDGFVVADDDSDDDFETMAPPRSKSRSQGQLLGPPISRDARMSDAELNGLHDDIIRSFLDEAKDLEENIRNSKNLRLPIFTEQQLREMAIRWTVSLDEMRLIPGIKADKVDRYGGQLLPLIRQYHGQFQEIMSQMSPRAAAVASGPRAVVDLVSSDDEMEDIEDDDGEDLEDQGAVSSYFAPSAKQARSGAVTSSSARSTTASASTSRQSKASGSTWRGSKKPFQRRSSGGSNRGGKSFSGVRKKANSTRKTSGTSSASFSGPSRAGSKTKGGSRGRAQSGGLSGIGLMEH